MIILANISIFLVASLHVCFMIVEMFYWTKPLGIRIFGLKPEFARSSKTLAMNQGLYNGFLAAGLFWGLLAGPDGYTIKIMFLVFVIIAGLFGAVTANKNILLIQALPGALALVAVLFA
jgi:putative membrane protein